MICYKDRTYCDSNRNTCTNTRCDRHLKTKLERFSLVNNAGDLPIALCDLSKDCIGFRPAKDN